MCVLQTQLLIHVNKTPPSRGSVRKACGSSPGHVSCVLRRGEISEEFAGCAVATRCGFPPSHLLHAAGPMQILRQRLVGLVCKMSSLPLTSAGKTAWRLSLQAGHGAVPDCFGLTFSGSTGLYVMLIWHRRGAGAVHLSVRTNSSHIHLLCEPARRWALTQQGKRAGA